MYIQSFPSMFSYIINYLNKYILIWYISVALCSKLPRIIFWVYFNEQTRTVNKNNAKLYDFQKALWVEMLKFTLFILSPIE